MGWVFIWVLFMVEVAVPWGCAPDEAVCVWVIWIVLHRFFPTLIPAATLGRYFESVPVHLHLPCYLTDKGYLP